MKLLAEHVRELLAELAPLLHGAEVIDVAPLPPRDLVLVLEPPPAAFPGGGGPKVLRLRLSANPDAARLHLVQERLQRHVGPVGPFFQRVQEELPGATLVRLEQVRGDRIVLVELRGGPTGERRALVLELTGRHANLVLLGPGDRVLALCVPPPSGKSPPRLVLGEPWSPPGGRAAAPERSGPGLVESLPEPGGPPPAPAADRAPLSWRVESALGGAASERLEEQVRKRLLARIARKLERARAWQAGLQARQCSGAESDRVRQDGELLKAHQAELRRGLDSIVVQDWFSADAPERRIVLDPKLGPVENTEKLFARYRKLEHARATAAEELAIAEARLADLEELERRAQDEGEDPQALDARAVAKGLLDPLQEADPRKRKAPAPRKPYRVFHSCRGHAIWVGRTARDNDELTVRLARGSDLWLHTADVPGSHVVLRLERGAEPDEQEVLDAAHLAIHFSPQRGTDRAPVHVALKKHVHKPRGAKPGLVTLSGGRILQVRLQPERLQRLLRGTFAPEDGA